MSEKAEFKIEKLDPKKHGREQFVCESPEFTAFLQKQARKEMQARASASYVLVQESNPSGIMGFYTLSQTSVELDKLPERLKKKLPHYDQVGATLLGRLARHQDWKGKKIGELLLIDALRRALRHSEGVGAVVVVTDPKDEKASEFYRRHGFLPLDESRMFLPMSEIVPCETSETDG
jgi:GNAT superfamily N-acetyltransferase